MKRQQISTREAEAMLPDGNTVHTFTNPNGVLLGMDYDRKVIMDMLTNFKPELSGSLARSMNHGICVNDGEKWVFIETKKEEA